VLLQLGRTRCWSSENGHLHQIIAMMQNCLAEALIAVHLTTITHSRMFYTCLRWYLW